MMYLKKLVVWIVISFSIVGCFWNEAHSAKVFNYDGALHDVSLMSKHHADILKSCLDRWDYERDLRQHLSSRFLKDVHSGDIALFMEFGGSSTSQYDYIYVSNGKLRSSILPSTEIDTKALRLADLSEEGFRNMFYEISPNVEENVVDGGCHFVSIAYKGESKQVAMYGRNTTGRKSAGWINNLIKELVLLSRESGGNAGKEK